MAKRRVVEKPVPVVESGKVRRKLPRACAGCKTLIPAGEYAGPWCVKCWPRRRREALRMNRIARR